MKEIAIFFQNVLLKSKRFNSATAVSDPGLLYPPFLAKVQACIKQYRQAYPNQDITFIETYRSNALQLIHYNNGASKIKKNGMHHYGIAADSIFIGKGKRTYQGDITLLRKIYKENDLYILGNWDPLCVQFIAVPNQPELRNTVQRTIRIFQTKYNIPFPDEPDNITIAKAKEIFG